MPEKGVMLSSPVVSHHPLHRWRLSALTSLVFFLMVILWSIDGCTIKTFIDSYRLNPSYYSMRVASSSSSSSPLDPTSNITNQMDLRTTRVNSHWISVEMEPNFTANLLKNWSAPGGGEKCREAKTVDISVPNIDGKGTVELTAGEIHEFRFQSLDASGEKLCVGGDYFETDLSGENWKSRPPVKDLGNGTYSVSGSFTNAILLGCSRPLFRSETAVLHLR